LDLSFNLINTLAANKEVAQALKLLPSLASLKYLGNVDGVLSVGMLYPVQSYQALQKALPHVTLKTMTRSQARSGALVFALVIGCIVLVIALSATSIYMYNALPYVDLGYAMACGSVAILVLIALFIIVWVLYHRLIERLDITRLLARAIYRRRRPNGQNALASPAGVAVPGEVHVDLRNLVEDLNEIDHEFAQRLVTMQAQAGTDSPAQGSNTSRRRADAKSYEEDEAAAALLQPDEALEYAMKLDPKIMRKLPMLLEQYLMRTAVPATLDMNMWQKHAAMLQDFTVHSFFHSYSPLTLAMRKRVVHLLLLVIVSYYCVISGLLLVPWYMETDALPLMSYRLVVTKLLNGQSAVAPNVRSLSLIGDDVFAKVPIMDSLSTRYVSSLSLSVCVRECVRV
jgi:hypothetical protein